jgi:hypothetical protein
MNKLLSALALLLFFQLLSAPAGARELDQEIYRVITVGGDIFIGTLVQEDDEHIVLHIENVGELTMQRVNIRQMTQIDPSRIRDGEYWFVNPQPTRYYFAPNAFGLRDGNGYYQNTLLFFNNVNYGISDRFSIGGGLAPLFLLGASETPLWVLPKISVPLANDKVHLAAGAMLGGLLGTRGDAESRFLGLVYGLGTIGTYDNNLSLGAGFGYQGREFSSKPVINFSGMTRTGVRFYLITENYLFWTEQSEFRNGTFVTRDELTGVVSLGIRWAPENFAVDFYLARPLEETGEFIAFPLLGVTIPFGG